VPAVVHPDVIVRLGPGDALVCFTDGITEGRGANGVMYGDERLAELLATCVGLTAAQIADHLVAAVLDYQGGQTQDDLALLVLRVPPA
jgi:phosphoserine phosphatase RsbU/P